MLFCRSILTKDVLLQSGWKGSAECMLCTLDKNIDTIIFSLVWGVVNCAFNLGVVPDSVDNITGWIPSFPVSFRGVLTDDLWVYGNV